MGEKKKILVVEDEWIVADQLCRSLKKFGYRVSLPVSSGAEAIKSIEGERPDMILMDILLQGEMDGIETASLIESRFDIPIIYVTAHTTEDFLNRAKLTKPFGYLSKPFNDNEIHSTIKMALYKHKVDKGLKERHERLERAVKDTIDAIVEIKN